MAQFLGKTVGPIGYGLMGFTWRPQPQPVEQSIAAMKAALENGMTLWNGAEFYGTPEYNSMTLLKAYFTKYPEDADKVTLIIKGGVDITNMVPNGSAANIRRSMENIIKQLGGTKKVDMYNCARRDPNTPLTETFGVLQEYIDAGKLGSIALSEVRAETIHEAVKIAKIGTVEVELSMFSPNILENGVAAACAEHGIPITAYSPIERGLLSGRFKTTEDTKGFGMISRFPRFAEGNFEHNLKLVHQIEAIAKEKGCTPAQLAINWVRSKSNRPGLPTIVPIPGATTVERVKENSKVIDLTEEDISGLDHIVETFEPAGGRYPPGAHQDT